MTLAVNSAWAELAKLWVPGVEVWPVSHHRLVFDAGYRVEVLRRTRRAGFETVLFPRYSPEFMYEDALVRASGAPERVGFDGDIHNRGVPQRLLSDRWFTRLVQSPADGRMEIDHNADFLRALGIEYEAGIASVDVPAEARRPPDPPYFVLAPGASDLRRAWPAARFAEIADRIHERTGWRGLVCGAPSEVDVVRDVCATAKAPLENLAGKTTLIELAGAFASARLVVANDSGPIHLATILDVPSVCVVGGGQFGRFVPYRRAIPGRKHLPLAAYREMSCFGCAWRCKFAVAPGASYPCIDAVGVEPVWTLVEANLAACDGAAR